MSLNDYQRKNQIKILIKSFTVSVLIFCLNQNKFIDKRLHLIYYIKMPKEEITNTKSLKSRKRKRFQLYRLQKSIRILMVWFERKYCLSLCSSSVTQFLILFWLYQSLRNCFISSLEKLQVPLLGESSI